MRCRTKISLITKPKGHLQSPGLPGITPHPGHFCISVLKSDLNQALGDCCGTWADCLQTDDYQAYTSYQRDHADLVDLNNCATHIRRGFKKALDLGERDAARVVKLLSSVYRLVAQLREEKAGPALRHAVRGSHVAHRLRLIRRYLGRIRSRHLPGSEMGKAISYALDHWDRFESYLTDGRVELCNNLIENAIRPLKLGAMNDLFFGSARGGEPACVAYTLIENCKRHGLDVRSSLMEAMRMLDGQGPARAGELTPAAVAKARRMRQVS